MKKVSLLVLTLGLVFGLVWLFTNSLAVTVELQSETEHGATSQPVPVAPPPLLATQQQSRTDNPSDNTHFLCNTLYQPHDGISFVAGFEKCKPIPGEGPDMCYINNELIGPCAEMGYEEFAFGARSLHQINKAQVTEEEIAHLRSKSYSYTKPIEDIRLPAADYSIVENWPGSWEEYVKQIFNDLNSFWANQLLQVGLQYEKPKLEFVDENGLVGYLKFVDSHYPYYTIYKDNPLYLPYKGLIIFPYSNGWGTILPARDKATRIQIATLVAQIVGIHVQLQMYPINQFTYQPTLNPFPIEYEADYLAGVYASVRIPASHNMPDKYILRWAKRRYAYMSGFKYGFKSYKSPTEWYLYNATK